MTTILIFIGVLMTQVVQAQEQECAWGNSVFENAVVSQYYFSDTDNCGVSVRHKGKYPIYRSYAFYSSGLFSIFNSYDRGEGVHSTGARNFFFFPRVHRVHWSHQVDQKQVTIRLAKSSVYFSTDKVVVSASAGAKIDEDTKVHPENDGGVEIQSYWGIYLDAGFAFGHASYQDKNKISKFVDHRGNECEVQNYEIFDYIYGEDERGNVFLDEVVLKFAPHWKSNQVADESELRAYLGRRCTQLDLSYL